MYRIESKDKLIALNYLGLLSIAGEDAKKFLQGQFTCDLEEISPTQSRMGAQCNPQGRVICLFRLYWFNNQYLLQIPRELIPRVMASLKKYAVFFKVHLTDVSDVFKQMGYTGQLDQYPNSINEGLEINHHLIVRVNGADARYMILGENNFFTHEAAQPEENWKYLEIHSNIPTIYPETSEKFLPHELNLPQLNAISFKKGCYTGQEIIARMEYKAKLKKRLFSATAHSPITPLRGGEIYQASNPCGNIVDFCQVGYNKWELLVIAPIDEVTQKTLSLDTEQQIILNFK